jgi:hypothetical protein
MPYSNNMLYDFGVGPILLPGIVADGKLHTPVQIGHLWWPITIFGWCTAALLLVELMERAFLSCLHILVRGNQRLDAANLFLFLVGLALSLGFFLPGLDIIYDRYYVMSLLPVGLLFAQSVSRDFSSRFSKVALVSTFILISFSTICLQDYMAWNGARWDALATLRQAYAATPDEIDGGYEFNGLYNSAALIDDEDPRRYYGPKGGWVIDDRYAVSIRPRENFETIERVGYFSWLGMCYQDILIQRRIDNGT